MFYTGSIIIKSPLTKASISTNNGGGGNWGGEGTITEEEPTFVGETKEEPSECPPGALRVLPAVLSTFANDSRYDAYLHPNIHNNDHQRRLTELLGLGSLDNLRSLFVCLNDESLAARRAINFVFFSMRVAI